MINKTFVLLDKKIKGWLHCTLFFRQEWAWPFVILMCLMPGSDYTILARFWHDSFDVGCRGDS